MPIDFENLKKYKQLSLGEYHPELEGQTLDVWINPSRRVGVAFYDEALPVEDRVKSYYCAIWDIRHEDFDLLLEDGEPALVDWMTTQSNQFIAEYANARKKVVKD